MEPYKLFVMQNKQTGAINIGLATKLSDVISRVGTGKIKDVKVLNTIRLTVKDCGDLDVSFSVDDFLQRCAALFEVMRGGKHCVMQAFETLVLIAFRAGRNYPKSTDE